MIPIQSRNFREPPSDLSGADGSPHRALPTRRREMTPQRSWTDQLIRCSTGLLAVLALPQLILARGEAGSETSPKAPATADNGLGDVGMGLLGFGGIVCIPLCVLLCKSCGSCVERPRAQRRAQAEWAIDPAAVAGVQVGLANRAINVHQGTRDEITEGIVNELSQEYFDFLKEENVKETLNDLSAFLNTRVDDGTLDSRDKKGILKKAKLSMSHINKAGTTLAIRTNGGKNVPVSHVLAIIWKFIAEQDCSDGERECMKMGVVRALASAWLHGLYCNQGVAQRILEVIENVHPKVKFPQQIPEPGAFVIDFGQEVQRLDPDGESPPVAAKINDIANDVLERAHAIYSGMANMRENMTKIVCDLSTYLTQTYAEHYRVDGPAMWSPYYRFNAQSGR